MIRVQIDMLVHADKPEYAKHPPTSIGPIVTRIKASVRNPLYHSPTNTATTITPIAAAPASTDGAQAYLFMFSFFDLVICITITSRKMVFRSSIHISSMFSPPAVSLVCLWDRLVKQRIGISHGHQLIHPALTKRCRKQGLCAPRAIMDHDMRMPIPARDAVFMELRQICDYFTITELCRVLRHDADMCLHIPAAKIHISHPYIYPRLKDGATHPRSFFALYPIEGIKEQNCEHA